MWEGERVTVPYRRCSKYCIDMCMYAVVFVFGSLDAIRIRRGKEQYNLARHGIDFPTAALIFDDPYAMTIRDVLHDEDEDEERYNTVGEFSPGSILFVVHTLLFTHCSRMKRAKK